MLQKLCRNGESCASALTTLKGSLRAASGLPIPGILPLAVFARAETGVTCSGRSRVLHATWGVVNDLYLWFFWIRTCLDLQNDTALGIHSESASI
jgi:hypothetical protein